jgi:hypothetical protein
MRVTSSELTPLNVILLVDAYQRFGTTSYVITEELRGNKPCIPKAKTAGSSKTLVTIYQTKR